MTGRPRERIFENLESIYREAYDRAKLAGDDKRMLDLDAAYRRSALEVLLDIRDTVAAPPPAGRPAEHPRPTATLEACAASPDCAEY
jgi:hypothetical protein